MDDSFAMVVAIASAVVPGVLWLWVFTHGRSYRGAPLKVLVITFLLGVLSAVPVSATYWVIDRWFFDLDISDLAFASLGTVAVTMFFIVGPVEETFKFLSVRLWVYRTHHLRKPLDALIYGAAASLGFATIENIGYALSFGAEVMIVRGPVSTLAHVVFGSIWALSLNPQAPPARRRAVGVVSLPGAALLHGLFNVLVFSVWGILPAFALIGIGGYVVVRMFRRTKAASIYHLRRNMPLPVCSYCSSTFRHADNFCHGCGRRVAFITPNMQQCANCKEESALGTRFCPNCGDLFVYEGAK